MEKKQFFIVIALIRNNKGEILLARRNEPAVTYAHNKWEFVGGGIDFGEDPQNALIREAKEEAGVDIKILRLLPKILTHTWHLEKAEHQIIMLAYECEIASGELKPGLDQEIAELKFIHPKDLQDYDTLPKTLEIINLLNL